VPVSRMYEMCMYMCESAATGVMYYGSTPMRKEFDFHASEPSHYSRCPFRDQNSSDKLPSLISSQYGNYRNTKVNLTDFPRKVVFKVSYVRCSRVTSSASRTSHIHHMNRDRGTISL
jgi:hypothetical protein